MTDKHIPGPCGCTVNTGYIAGSPLIEYCPTHALAPEMVEFVKKVANTATRPYKHKDQLLFAIQDNALTLLSRINTKGNE